MIALSKELTICEVRLVKDLKGIHKEMNALSKDMTLRHYHQGHRRKWSGDKKVMKGSARIC